MWLELNFGLRFYFKCPCLLEKQLGISWFLFLSVFYRDRVIRINLHNVSDTNCEVNDFICYF